MISETGLKRVISPGFVLAALAHAGLLVGLLVLGARGAGSVPPQQAIAVELVPASEVPALDTHHVNGTPLDSTSSGSEMSSDSLKGSVTTGAPQPKSALPSPEKAQGHLDPQHSPSAAAAPPLTAPPGQPELAQQANQAAAEQNAAEAFWMPPALLGGPLGTGLDAPSSDPAMLPHDDIAAFRARLSSCSHFLAEPGVDDNIKIVVRVSFKRDGTLASQPAMVGTNFYPRGPALMDAAVEALRKCQPFTELPADKYREWKTLDLIITPFALSGE
jgi:hypothetical protein